MLLKSKILKIVTTGVIAPHGMTDWIHAMQTNNVNMLLNINAITTGSFLFMHQTGNENFLNFVFILSSIIHFKHDIPFKNQFLSIAIVQMIFLFSLFDLDLLYMFLTFIHVPHHYIINWKYLSKTPLKSILILGISTILMLNFDKLQLNENKFIQPVYVDILKGIIVSHIVYQELFIHDTSNNLLRKIITK